MGLDIPTGPGMWVPSDEDDHNLAKAYKATSQADVMMAKATEPVHEFTIPHAQVLDIAKQPAVWAEKLSANSARLEFENLPNEQAIRVVLEVLPKVVELYLKKSRDYGGNVMELMDLGPSACIPDMLRKFGKIKRAVWDGEEMVGEQPDEIIMDLAGHIFIILDEMWNNEVR